MNELPNLNNTEKSFKKDVKENKTKLDYQFFLTIMLIIVSLSSILMGFTINSMNNELNNLNKQLKNYENNLLITTSELRKIELFRNEINSKNEILLNRIIKASKNNEEIYFYFYYNKYKENILEVYSLVYENNSIIEDKYLFDLKIE